MNQEIKRLWVNALLNGGYKQGTSMLRKNNGNGVDDFCCLGVLCDLYTQQNDDLQWLFKGYEYKIGETATYLPEKVRLWAGLDRNNPKVIMESRVQGLGDWNDVGKTFEEIALVIEKQL